MHVMIDLETMGTSPNAPIVAIGACRFDENGVGDDWFYETISLKSAIQNGAVLDPDTVVWWMGQERGARLEITDATRELIDALDDFRIWITKDEPDGVWGNGAGFDNMILSETYKRNNQPAPWSYKLDRCYRTIKSLSGVEMERTGTHHNALDDARSQANHLIAIWRAQ